jgi:hypothetical protein
VRPEDIPALDPATLPVPRRPAPRSGGPRSGGPLIPLLAAAAVVLIVTLSLVLSTVVAVPRPPAVVPGVPAVPPYYVALTATGNPAASHPVTLTVRSTFTGKVLATVAAPRPYGTFNLVDGTADDRTFLVGAQVWHPQIFGSDYVNNMQPPVQLYWLRFDPSTGQARLTPLPIPPFNGEYLNMASVSPDRTRLAVGYEDTTVRIYDLPSGAERTWSHRSPQGYIGWDRDNPASIAWAANDRTISFLWAGTNSAAEEGVHVANLPAQGSGDLLSIGRLALPMFTPSDTSYFKCASDPRFSANGAYILCGGYTVSRDWPISSPGYPKGPAQGAGDARVRRVLRGDRETDHHLRRPARAAAGSSA